VNVVVFFFSFIIFSLFFMVPSFFFFFFVYNVQALILNTGAFCPCYARQRIGLSCCYILFSER
jgi:hypothetical protein